ncbi:MAG: Tn3 family transposase, partial [Rickettsia aeschlimannii]
MFNNDTIFTLDSEEIALVTRHHTKENKLVFAVMLKFFQLEGRYPTSNDIIDQTMINHIALQLNLNSSIINFSNYDWSSRTIKRFRQEIRLLLGYNKPTIADSRKLIVWLIEHILPQAPTLAQISEHASKFYRQNHLESHKPLQLERYIATACHKFEQQFWQDIFQELSTETIKSIDLLLNVNDTALVADEEPTNFEISKGLEQIKLHELKKDIAGAKLKNITYAIDKLKRLRMLNLSDRLNLITRKLKQKYYLRICAELPSNIIEHPPVIRYAMMAIFCHFREQLITDNLVSSLIQLIHKIRTSAEMSVNKDILSEVKCVNGKFDILYTLANTSVEHPKGVIDDTIYPKISKETLQTLAKELICNKGRWYQQQVQRKMHSLYSYAHRRVLLTLLEVFTFQTNNHDYEAVLSAIEFIKTNKNIKDKYYPDSKLVPAIDLIPIKWQVLVVEEVENNSGQYVTKVNRINYEVAILEELHSLLSSKQVWVTGAYHYRNPEEDLPKDFDSNREYYYQKLGLPIDSNAFVQKLQDNLTESVQQFNNSIIHNKKVKIVCNKKDKSGQIKLTPYTAQLLPPNLLTIKQIINKNWSTVNLIDILKETDLRVGFTKHFHTVASRENINEQKLLKRLLLALYAIGSNTGLKRISAANDDISYTDLRYIKRRFLNTANVRVAITEVVNAIINIRDPRIWGTATTGCACDSTKVSSWDQNLMTEWHNRYKGRGVMIYWHVDKNATCIYSQLKTCSSSEVASMIKGVLDHCCKMDLQKTYVDTHGQSTI